MSRVICKIPKAGLGNQLFPIMRAYTFAHLNQLPVLVYNYHQVKVGPWLRGEKSKRNYKGFFNFEKNIFSEKLDHWKAAKDNEGERVVEPEIVLLQNLSTDHSYFFTSVPHYQHHFDGLYENRQLVIQLFWNIVSTKIKKQLSEFTKPCIGVHIRMGDFKPAAEGVKFGTTGHTRSPEEYFINTIQSIRKINGTSLPVSVFTDGKKGELKNLFQLENIHFIQGNNDLTDMLLLSKSDILIPSAGSTFSYWAAFISDAIIISHPAYSNLKIRTRDANENEYEGTLDISNDQLTKKIKSI